MLVLLTLVTLAGCITKGLSIPPEDALTPSARAALKLPAEDTLTLSTQQDMEFAAKLAPETVSAVMEFLKPAQTDVSIYAARPIGSHLLLWVSFPKIADGGIDLIWSVEEQKPVGWFLGGYRG